MTTSDVLPSPLTFERWVYRLREKEHPDWVVLNEVRRAHEILPVGELAFFLWLSSDLTIKSEAVLRMALETPGWMHGMRKHYMRATLSHLPAFKTLEEWIEAERQAWGPTGVSVRGWLEACERVEPGCFSSEMLPRYVPQREIDFLHRCTADGKRSMPELVQYFFQRPANIGTYRAIEEIAAVSARKEHEFHRESLTVALDSKAASVLRSVAAHEGISLEDYAARVLSLDALCRVRR